MPDVRDTQIMVLMYRIHQLEKALMDAVITSQYADTERTAMIRRLIRRNMKRHKKTCQMRYCDHMD
jgi:hypothetical protein